MSIGYRVGCAVLLDGQPYTPNYSTFSNNKTFQDALIARDKVVSLMEAKYSSSKLKQFSTVVAGFDESTGKIIVKAKNTNLYADTLCAENLVDNAFGTTAMPILMTPAIRPRNWSIIPVCPRCMTTFPESQFPFGYGGE
jgi:hypothetical protein